MTSFFHKFFHNGTVDRTEGGLVHVPEDPNDWPDEWKKVQYKSYSSFKPIFLPEAEGDFLETILANRRSSAKYFHNTGWTMSVLSYVLKCGYGIQECPPHEQREEFRMVPSAGKRYPLEIYVFIFKTMESLQPGIYHYDTRKHALELVTRMVFCQEDIATMCQQTFLFESSGMVCITSVFSRSVHKYGSRGYRFAILEAGHVAQNMILAGTEKGMNLIPVGGTNEDVIEDRIGLGTLNERVVYTLFL
ncbi:MAG TPA: SagB/ThcOx family dehydrogenase [Methanoregulaceae archaeon]|nr:SagB/ThcOx family dehydrogenase [Methanoregulaceae archaeon]